MGDVHKILNAEPPQGLHPPAHSKPWTVILMKPPSISKSLFVTIEKEILFSNPGKFVLCHALRTTNVTILQSDASLLPLKLRVTLEQLNLAVPPGHHMLVGQSEHGPPFGPYQPGLHLQSVMYRLMGLDDDCAGHFVHNLNDQP